jgi:hypothetical protein
MPWGYRTDPNDPQLMIPIEEHLDALMVILAHMDYGLNSRAAAEWLTEATGVPISYQTLIRYLKMYRKRRNFLNVTATYSEIQEEKADETRRWKFKEPQSDQGEEEA